MKASIWLFSLVALAISILSPFVHTCTVRGISDTRNKLFRKRGCDGSICFALQGSSSLNSTQTLSQKDLVATVARVLQGQGNVQLAAVQYGFITSAVSNLTSDTDLFLQRLDESELENDATTFLGGAIAYCDFALAGEADRNLVVIGNGKSTLFDPVQDAKSFTERGGNVFAVAVGNPDMEAIRAIAGENSARVFDLTNAKDINAVVVDIVMGLCRIDSC